jgi:hypothetical protein
VAQGGWFYIRATRGKSWAAAPLNPRIPGRFVVTVIGWKFAPEASVEISQAYGPPPS